MRIDQVTADQIPALRSMMEEYLAWAFSLQQGAEDAPTFAGSDDELKTLPGTFAPPRGRFLVAFDGETLLGAVGLKPFDHVTAELKRLYVRPEARGQNLGMRLVAQLIDEARREGYKRMILDSHKSMESAHAIYRKAGFKDVGPWPSFPEELVPVVVFMELNL